MLAAVDLNNEVCAVATEVDDEPLDANLPSKVRIFDPKPMTQVPPKFSLSFRWH